MYRAAFSLHVGQIKLFKSDAVFDGFVCPTVLRGLIVIQSEEALCVALEVAAEGEGGISVDWKERFHFGLTVGNVMGGLYIVRIFHSSA